MALEPPRLPRKREKQKRENHGSAAGGAAPAPAQPYSAEPPSRPVPCTPISDLRVSRLGSEPHRSAPVVPPVSIPVCPTPRPFSWLAALPLWSSPVPWTTPSPASAPAGMRAPSQPWAFSPPPPLSPSASPIAPFLGCCPPSQLSPESHETPYPFPHCHLSRLPPAPALDSGHHHTPPPYTLSRFAGTKSYQK
ncbi:uncharacterized protein [Equus caballus]|uniref:uncharacterized protein n=1 Tax=Equus caballus TaxID=9796 RepID=UPI0038B3187B